MPGTAFNPVLFNNAFAGFVAGWLTGRTAYVEASFEPVEPSDFAPVIAQGLLFATAVDDALNVIATGPGLPTNAQSLSNVETHATIVPGTAAVANAAESLPGALVFICKAAWSKTAAGRSLPILNASGAAMTAADYAGDANTCVSEFIEYCENTVNT
jgi:hypothetical protein